MKKKVSKVSDGIIRVILPEHISCRKKPCNLRTEDISLFSHEFEKTIFQIHALTLRHYWVVNELIFSLRNFSFCISYTFPRKWEKRIKALALNAYLIVKLMHAFLLLLNKCIKIPYGIWITDHKSKQFFHWFTDALPRLVAAEPIIKSHVLILPDYYQDIPYVTNSLTFFQTPVCFVRPTVKLEIGELILPSHTAEPGNYNRLIINKLRDIFLSRYKGSNFVSSRRIYISRKKANRRNVANEDKVVQVLLTYGFEIHYFEDYCLEKQIQICAQARTIVGLHGAGLTNMLFMPEKGQVLEFRNQNDDHNNCYFSLASVLNLEYYYQIGKGNRKRTYAVTLMVDISELKENLKIMRLAPSTNRV